MTLREIAEKKLYFRYGTSVMYGTSFWFVDKEQPDPENTVVIRDGDCGEVRRPHTISREEFDELVRADGLWRQTGLWSFAPYDDPAIASIRYCHRNPDAAGRELYRLQERLRRLKNWILPLYDSAIEAEMEVREFLATEDYSGGYTDADLTRAALRRERIRRWMPGGGER